MRLQRVPREKVYHKCIFMEIKMWLKHSRDQMSSPCWNNVGSKGLHRTSLGRGVASYNSSYTWQKERSASLNWVVAMLWYVLTLRCWTSRPRIFSWPSPGQRRYPQGSQSRSAPRWHSRYIHLGNNLKKMKKMCQSVTPKRKKRGLRKVSSSSTLQTNHTYSRSR